jgi:hypothetical protein
MKFLVRAVLAIALLAPTTGADAACFLFFCPRYHHRHVTTTTKTPRVSGFCKGVQNAAAKSKVSPDDFIGAFPSGDQDKVSKCLGLAL